jgi:hypothetical protein
MSRDNCLMTLIALCIVIVITTALVCGIRHSIRECAHAIAINYRTRPAFGTTTLCSKCGGKTMTRRVVTGNTPYTITAICTSCGGRTIEQTLDAPKETTKP